MENQLGKFSAPASKIELVEDGAGFARFLAKARFLLNKSARKIGLEIGEENHTIQRWERLDVPAFPDETQLPDIARAYNVDLEELRNKFLNSINARDKFKDVRKKNKVRQAPVRGSNWGNLPGNSGNHGHQY